MNPIVARMFTRENPYMAMMQPLYNATQMLQDRLADANAQRVVLQNEISNYNQSQYILGQTGRWVGWATSGSTTGTAGT